MHIERMPNAFVIWSIHALLYISCCTGIYILLSLLSWFSGINSVRNWFHVHIVLFVSNVLAIGVMYARLTFMFGRPI